MELVFKRASDVKFITENVFLILNFNLRHYVNLKNYFTEKQISTYKIKKTNKSKFPGIFSLPVTISKKILNNQYYL